MLRRLFEKLKLVKPRQPHLPQTNVRRSFSYEEAKKIYIEGLAIGQLVELGKLPSAEKFEEMLHRMNFVR